MKLKPKPPTSVSMEHLSSSWNCACISTRTSLKLGVEVYTVGGGDMGISKNSSYLKSHLKRKEKETNKEKEKGVKEFIFLEP